MSQGSQVKHHLLLLEPDESPRGDVETELRAILAVTNASDIAHYFTWEEVSPKHVWPSLFIWKYSYLFSFNPMSEISNE